MSKVFSIAKRIRDAKFELDELSVVQRQEARFWASVAVGGEDECWLHDRANGSKHVQHYDSTRAKREFAHRLAYRYGVGPIPVGLCVCHSCDTPACCNPAHLWLGTVGDNVRDMWRKGRGKLQQAAPNRARGEKISCARLTADDARLIVQSKDPHTSIATRLGVSDVTVRNVRMGRTWAHATGVDSETAQKRWKMGRSAKLSASVIRKILDANDKAEVLAKRFGVHRTTIYLIKRGAYRTQNAPPPLGKVSIK